MLRYGRRRLMRTLVAITGIIAIISVSTTLRFIIIQDNMLRHQALTARMETHLVYTSGCKIPFIDPWDKSVRHLLKAPGNKIKCDGRPPLTYTDGSWLRINSTALLHHYNNSLSRCSYEQINRRDDGTSDDGFKFTLIDQNFVSDKFIKSDFIRVACFCSRGKLMYANFHTLIQRYKTLEDRNKKRFSEHLLNAANEKLNVIMVGLDTMSRMNFIRQMPKSYAYLTKHLGAFDMMGFNKVADNTYVNLTPMLVGKFVEELPWDENKMSEPFDQYDFAWKRFSRKGYYTLMAEDYPEIAIFNYHKVGFFRQPTDYYLRPYSLAMESHGSLWNQEHHCFGSKLETEHVLDYVRDFTRTYKNQSYFAFSFITRLTHEDVNTAGAADEPHHKFLQELTANGSLNNTALIYFSDHGARFGKFRETYVGRLEERLPLMMLALPKWFLAKYQRIAANLETNTQRLTTPFDVRNLLMDILNFQPDIIINRDIDANNLSKHRAISWFNEIPVTRSCENAAILTHWCTCHDTESILTNSSDVLLVANSMVAFINSDIQRHNVTNYCHELFLHQVHQATKIKPNEKVLHFKESFGDVINRKVTYGDRADTYLEYTLTIETLPGSAMFEATIRYSESDRTYSVIGEISRINRYGLQSDCVDNFNMKKFCYCR